MLKIIHFNKTCTCYLIMNIRKKSGFTLLEALMVMAIIAIVSSVSAPTFINMTKDANLDSAVYDLTTAVLNQRDRAILHGDPLILARMGTWNRWRLYRGTVVYFQFENEDNLTIESAVASIRFNSQGLLTNSVGVPLLAGATFTFCDERTEELGKIVTVSNMGRIHVTDFQCE